MKTNKFLLAAVVLLLIVNIALVVFMMKEKNNNKIAAKPDNSELMAKELNMTDEQKAAHKQLKEAHLKNIKPYFDSLRAAKTAFYALLKDSIVADSTLSTYSQRISERQSIIDKLTFAHLKRVRNLFSAEQQPKFDDFVQKIMQRNRRDSTAKKD